jgi:hypothetical protein
MPFYAQGLAVIFSHHQVCVKKKGGHFLGGPKVKVDGLVFVLPIKLLQISLFFAD